MARRLLQHATMRRHIGLGLFALVLGGRAQADDAFYTKHVDYAGIPIRAHQVVDDEALARAKARVAMMLASRPDIAATFAATGVELHIIGKDQVTSDLPEHRHLKGKPFDGNLTVDERTRGLGGKLASCGEENLLQLATDRYRGRDICVHEFAHTIFNLGLSAEVRARVENQYRRSTQRALWPTYAATNADEFFAELSMWWFDSQGDPGTLSPAPGAGREWLVAHDAEAAALLADIYAGRLVPLSSARIRATTSTGPAAWVRFENHASRTTKVWWLDDRGRRHHYKTLGAGDSYLQSTYAGHAWLITDAADQPLYAFLADTVSRVASIR